MLTKSVASLNEGLKADFETYMQVVKREEESKKDVRHEQLYEIEDHLESRDKLVESYAKRNRKELKET